LGYNSLNSFNAQNGVDTADIDISSDMVNNAGTLAPALGMGNDFIEGAIVAVRCPRRYRWHSFRGPRCCSSGFERDKGKR
jgi:hypothetical protein